MAAAQFTRKSLPRTMAVTTMHSGRALAALSIYRCAFPPAPSCVREVRCCVIGRGTPVSLQVRVARGVGGTIAPPSAQLRSRVWVVRRFVRDCNGECLSGDSHIRRYGRTMQRPTPTMPLLSSLTRTLYDAAARRSSKSASVKTTSLESPSVNSLSLSFYSECRYRAL